MKYDKVSLTKVLNDNGIKAKFNMVTTNEMILAMLIIVAKQNEKGDEE